MITVSAVVRNKAAAAGALDWLGSLPDLVADLAAEWALEIGEPMAGGTEAYVVTATLADGTEAVLKAMIPDDPRASRREIAVLARADGRGCARLLRSDPDRGALLLERLGPSMSTFAFSFDRRLELLCDTATAFWRPAVEIELPTGAEKAAWLSRFIEETWEALGRPCTSATIAHALRCAARRRQAHRRDRAVIVHGDIHQWNALQAGVGFKLVDPDGLIAEPEYDLGVLMREDPVELMAGEPYDRAVWLGRRTGLDVDAIWEWGVVERVSTGLLGVQVGLEPVASQMLGAAERIARQPHGRS
ncbi:MAG TPA: aminoglycoside phosphotransferase family protein [Acidimicrobiales bacterium]|nr:aminoglycoside phosphotransferase family protein [Acidimicrobiales bacterium]